MHFHLKSSLFIISTFLFQCYYVGGLDESATGMLGEVSKPVSWGMPAEKICMKLYKKDAQICDIKYGKHYKITQICVTFYVNLSVPCFYSRENY